MIFGHYGDRIGRKAALIATLLLTGLATFAVGFVPTYEQVGIWGAVIPTFIRFIQGIGVGGEWGGSVLLSMEWARTNAHRGFVASWPQLGAPAGLLLANIAVLMFSRISGDRSFWGRGLATEAANACVGYAFAILGSAGSSRSSIRKICALSEWRKKLE
jgi:MFS family permease